jgi:hypothetical protein
LCVAVKNAFRCTANLTDNKALPPLVSLSDTVPAQSFCAEFSFEFSRLFFWLAMHFQREAFPMAIAVSRRA